MAVTGKRTWYIAAVILGQGFVYYRLEWDDAIISQLITVEERFWNDHVIPRALPDPDGTEICNEVLNEYFRTVKKNSSIRLPEEFDRKLNYREELVRQIEVLTKEKNRIEQEVKLAMGENETAGTEHFKISWSNVETNRLDSSRIKKEKPEIYKEFMKAVSSRRLQIRMVERDKEVENSGKENHKAA